MFIAAHEVELRRILVITDWCVDGLDAAHSLREKLHLGERKLGKIGKLLLGRLPAVLLQEVLLVTADLVVGLRHVDRNADGVAEVGHGTRDGLTDPPGRIGRELVASAILELVHSLHQTKVALLNQVGHRETAVDIALGDRDHQTQVRLDHAGLGLHEIRLRKLEQTASSRWLAIVIIARSSKPRR